MVTQVPLDIPVLLVIQVPLDIPVLSVTLVQQDILDHWEPKEQLVIQDLQEGEEEHLAVQTLKFSSTTQQRLVVQQDSHLIKLQMLFLLPTL